MTTTADLIQPRAATPGTRVSMGATGRTVLALVARDMSVLFHQLPVFILRTAMQPMLFAFVFAYVFPRIGQGIGGTRNSAAFASVLLPGLMANTLMFQGVTAVALPLVQEFVNREIEDRVMAPAPVMLVGLAKVLGGALQSIFAAALVIPAVWIATAGDLHIDWGHPLLLVTLIPLGALVGSALGMMLGTVIAPRQINFLFALLLLPLTLLGCVYYPWATLRPIRWLQLGVLLNPVVYMSEGLRAALSPNVKHLSLWGIYALLLGALVVLLTVGLRNFQRRVLS